MTRGSAKIISEELYPALQGAMPSAIATCTLDGVVNITCVSQIYYVDETHVALTNQFFNKTIRNIQENPFLCAIVTCPIKYKMWKLVLRFIESQSSGIIFEKMKLQLEVIASMQQMTGVFVLRAADIYELVSIEKLE